MQCVVFVSTLQNMLKKFPFEDSILKDLDVINPDKICSYSYENKSLAQRFPQIGLAESDELDHLREEFMDFKLIILLCRLMHKGKVDLECQN